MALLGTQACWVDEFGEAPSRTFQNDTFYVKESSSNNQNQQQQQQQHQQTIDNSTQSPTSTYTTTYDYTSTNTEMEYRMLETIKNVVIPMKIYRQFLEALDRYLKLTFCIMRMLPFRRDSGLRSTTFIGYQFT